jgi:DNA-binding MarR family transcriptional regulator
VLKYLDDKILCQELLSFGMDRLDALAAQWAAVRPDIEGIEVMAVVARLLHVGRLLQARLAESATEHGLQVADGDVLFTLRRAGEPYRLSPGRLADALLVATGTMTGRLDRLEKRGLVRRIPNPDDRRALEVELTAEGLALVDAVIGEHVAREHEMLAPLSATEREQLVRITRKLLRHLET